MVNKNFKLMCLLLVGFCFSNCENDMPDSGSGNYPQAVPVQPFNWETVSWMPTPPGQTLIPPPWIGQGSLSYAYSSEIINDMKSADGWVLLYSTFCDTGSNIINPYFILYNKYRGLMRIYLYVTTQFVAPSTYMWDVIGTRNGDYPTSMLNFLGTDFVDATGKTKLYSQMQPAPSDGSLPLAANRWYMMQYEIAYDPEVSQIGSENIQFQVTINSANVDSVNLGGVFEGKLNGTIGAATNSNGFFSDLLNVGKVAGTGALAIVGKDFLTNNTTDSTGANTLGLSNGAFKMLTKGVENAISSAAGGLPAAAVSLLSAIIGGSSGTGQTPISLNINADIDLRGSITSSLSMPSTPVTFYVPGSDISSSAVGYIPVYNKPLGVLNFVGKPPITINIEWQYHEEFPGSIYGAKWTDSSVIFPSNVDYSDYLIINPEVLQIADVSIESQDLVYAGRGMYGPNACEKNRYEDFIIINPERDFWRRGMAPLPDVDFPGISDIIYSMPVNRPSNLKVGVRFTVKITPHGGAPSSTIMKTFLLNPQWNYIQTYYMMCHQLNR